MWLRVKTKSKVKSLLKMKVVLNTCKRKLVGLKSVSEKQLQKVNLKTFKNNSCAAPFVAAPFIEHLRNKKNLL